MVYNDGFKARMVQRMVGSEQLSAHALSQEVGVPQPTLSRWLRDARTVSPMGGSRSGISKKPAARSTRQWTAEEKLRVVSEASGLSEEDLGAFLRREGLHSSQLESWRKQATDALSPQRSSRKKSPEKQRVQELEREIGRKDKALAEVTALLALSKKVQLLLGDADDDTRTSSET